MSCRRQETKLSAGAGVDGHVGVDLQHHVLVLVEEQDAEGGHLLWDAAWLGNAGHDAHGPDDALDGRVVRGLQGLDRKKHKKHNSDSAALPALYTSLSSKL